ncbi:MAG: isoleucine--tRNA ligase [Ignavibacteria bacterium]|nr:isoleucine--tRNA ligase [Ignavibacteria bacterium]
MYKELPENISLPELEKEVINFWKEDDTFQKSIESKSSEKSFTFYEGPPTANGLPGIHHVISRTVKDLFCRYKAMHGYKVNRKAGWDTHGLPVEIEVEKSLGLKSKADIEAFGVIEFNKACKDSIFKYVSRWEDLTQRMGYWVNLDEAYVTYHNSYIESVWWALKNYYDKDLIYKGYKILPFCPKCESSLSSHEVAQGYEDLKDPSVYVKFKISTGEFAGSDFLVWTTTPWTLPSNVALAVNPKFTYAKIVTAKGEHLILLRERLSVISEEYSIEKEFEGSSLENTEYNPLFTFYKLEKKAFYVTLGDFVSAEDGTGIVHIAPAFGEDDYTIGRKYGLPIIQAVGKDGLFKKEVTPYAGNNFKEADKQISDDLKAAGRLYKREMFTHSYPHCWRHHVPLMYYATDSWFIETTKYNERMMKQNNKVYWQPEEVGSGRFGQWLEDNIDWCLSRDRFWGTPLPVWTYTDENGKEHFECIGSIEELKQRSHNFSEVYPTDEDIDLHKPFIDNVKIKSKDGHEMKRVREVIDCWFDSGSMPFAQWHYPFENKEIFEKNFPADFIAEGVDQTRGWFYSLIAINTFLFDKAPYKSVIVNGHILDKFGKKMSKSLGNVVNPFDMMEKHGADLLRWYLVGNSPVGKSKLFNEDELVELKNKLFDTLINTYKFFTIYSGLTNFDYKKSDFVPVENRSVIDKWIISKLNTLKKEYFELMDAYEVTKACRLIFDFTIDELSNWYIRRNRKRFRNPENEQDRNSAYQTVYEVLINIVQMMAPVSPFLSERLYQNLTKEDSSIHLSEFSKCATNEIDEALEEQMNIAQRIVYLTRAIRVKNNLKVRQPLRQILIPVLNAHEKETISKFKDIILEEVNVKELNFVEGDSEIIKKKAKPNFKSIGPKFGKDVKTVQAIINSFNADDIKSVEKDGSISKGGFVISTDDIEILTENITGWIVDTDKNLTIAVDTSVDDNLKREGSARDLVKEIQDSRKLDNFEVSDKIDTYIFNPSHYIEDTVSFHKDYIASSTGSNDIYIIKEEPNKFFGSQTINIHESSLSGDPIIYVLKK